MQRSLKGNIWRYHASQAPRMPAFFVPVIVLFWRGNGLDELLIYVIQGIFALVVVLLEVPMAWWPTATVAASA